MESGYPMLWADDEGVWLQDGSTRNWGIRWDEVFVIAGYKLDRITSMVTVLELDFEFGEYIEINSSLEGFTDVVAAITEKLPVLQAGWFEDIEDLKPNDEPIIAWRRES